MDNEILQSIVDYLAEDRFEDAYRLLDAMDNDDYKKAVEYLNDRSLFNIGESYKIYLMDIGIPILAEHQNYAKIARDIEALEEESMDYDLMLLYSLAYTSMGDCERALEILEEYSDQGQDDAIYHTRLSMNYEELRRTDDAVDEIEDALSIDPECEDALLHGAVMYRNLDNIERSTELENTLKEINPELWKEYFGTINTQNLRYTDEEIQCVENHIDTYFGHFENVLHEIVSPDLHIDLAIIPPNEQKDYYTVVTMGMGAFKMNVPENKNDNRMELVMYFPKDWNLNSANEHDYWPIRELKTLARFPLMNDTWLSAGHTITNGNPFSEYTGYNGFIIANVAAVPPDAYQCTLPNGEDVWFYQAIPLYEEELMYKIDNSAGDLIEKLLDYYPFVFYTNRPCLFTDKVEKKWAIPKSCIVPLLEWDGAAGCFATDRIMVDGEPISFMYREKPDNEKDSGWRFVAGDESPEYMSNPKNMGIYHLNTICNYDKSIIPLLDSPYGTAYRRDENNVLVLDTQFGMEQNNQDKNK